MLVVEDEFDSLLAEPLDFVELPQKPSRSTGTLSWEDYQDALQVYADTQSHYCWTLQQLEKTEHSQLAPIRKLLTQNEEWLFAIVIPENPRYEGEAEELELYRLTYGYNQDCDPDVARLLYLPLDPKLMERTRLRYNRLYHPEEPVVRGDPVLGVKLRLPRCFQSAIGSMTPARRRYEEQLKTTTSRSSRGNAMPKSEATSSTPTPRPNKTTIQPRGIPTLHLKPSAPVSTEVASTRMLKLLQYKTQHIKIKRVVLPKKE